LSGIITLTTLLSDDDTLTPYQRDLVNTVRASGTLLLGIVRRPLISHAVTTPRPDAAWSPFFLSVQVNDILDFSKLEAGKVSLKDFNFDLQACVESVCDVLVLQAQKKGIELVCYVDTDIPTYVRGDPGAPHRPQRPVWKHVLAITAHSRSHPLHRSRPASAGDAQPREQRDQVHFGGRGQAHRRSRLRYVRCPYSTLAILA
jgi:hypothetical protein